MARLILVTVIAGTILGCAPAEGEEAVARPGRNAVVVELFTSQGCSSCPPADKVLRDLALDDALSDVVIPLSFHVDYWNYLGWSDPFSSQLWSERQGRYTRALGVGVYTPQAIVNGRVAMVGSRRRDVRRAILEESRREPKVSLALENLTTEAARLSAEVSASSGDYDVWLVVSESGLVTEVARGENRGRKLVNDRVVRWLQLVDVDATTGRGRVKVDLAPSWKQSALEVAVFAQDPHTMRIVGAARWGSRDPAR